MLFRRKQANINRHYVFQLFEQHSRLRLQQTPHELCARHLCQFIQCTADLLGTSIRGGLFDGISRCGAGAEPVRFMACIGGRNPLFNQGCGFGIPEHSQCLGPAKFFTQRRMTVLSFHAERRVNGNHHTTSLAHVKLLCQHRLQKCGEQREQHEQSQCR